MASVPTVSGKELKLNIHPSFDQEEASIAASLVPEGAEPGTSPTAVPTDGAVPPADSAQPVQQQATQTEPTVQPTQTATPAQGTTEPTPQAAQQQTGDIRGALRASRRQEKALRERVQELERQNEELKAGKTPVNDSNDLTPEELEELRVDFPAQFKVYQETQRVKQQLEAIRPPPQAADPEFQPRLAPPEVQTLIDEVPTLVSWQHDPQAQDKFDKAIEYDEALRHDPDWKGRPVVDRFNEAARRAAAAFGLATPAPSQAAHAAATRIDPAQAIAGAQVAQPKGISDFPGGAPANAPTIDYSRMSDEAILASLPVQG